MDGVVPDATGAHDGQASAGVTLVEPGHRGQAFALDGAGVITVPHDPEFEFTDGFMVQAAVRPPPEAGGPDTSVLVQKDGQFRLDLVRVSGELRARFAVETAAGEESVISAVPLLAGEWSLVSGRYESGRLWVGTDTETNRSDDFTYLSGAPVHSASEIRIGPAFKGQLDEVRILDLSKTPLSTFANGQTSISFVADATGTFEMPIVSTGRLAQDRRAVQYQRTLAREELAQAGDEPPPTSLQAGLGSELIEAETFWEDTAERTTTWYGYCSALLMGSMVKIARGILVGSEPGETDLAVMAGDIAGRIFLSPVAILRDMANSTERLIYAQPSGDDALNMALGLEAHAGAGERRAVLARQRGVEVGAIGRVDRSRVGRVGPMGEVRERRRVDAARAVGALPERQPRAKGLFSVRDDGRGAGEHEQGGPDLPAALHWSTPSLRQSQRAAPAARSKNRSTSRAGAVCVRPPSQRVCGGGRQRVRLSNFGDRRSVHAREAVIRPPREVNTP